MRETLVYNKMTDTQAYLDILKTMNLFPFNMIYKTFDWKTLSNMELQSRGTYSKS